MPVTFKPYESADHSAPVPNFLARIAALHAECEEITWLNKLLDRSRYVVVALPTLGLLALAATGPFEAGKASFAFLVVLATMAVARACISALPTPLDHRVLRAFEHDLWAMMLYSGMAWGLGAFLAVPAHASIAVVGAFAALPCLVISLLLRARKPVLRFIAPVTVLSVSVCILRAEVFAAGVVVLGCAAAAAISLIADRRQTPDFGPALRVSSIVTQR